MPTEGHEKPVGGPRSPRPGNHALHHPGFVPGCFLCKIESVQISPSATPTRQSDHAKWANRTQKAWDRDMGAYKRLRDDGLQPNRIDGSADLEAKAEIPEQVETGRLDFSPAAIRQAEETMGQKLKTPGNRLEETE